MTTPTEPTDHQIGTRSAGGRQIVASFNNYSCAQRPADRMPDGEFPVEQERIIGDGVRTVEHITGRMTNGRAALAGAASGAWFGLLIGLLFTIFTMGPLWIWAVLIATAISAFTADYAAEAARYVRAS